MLLPPRTTGTEPDTLNTIRFRTQTAELAVPLVMGILNTTPDSFSDGGKFISVQKAVDRMAEMAELGAIIIAIGGGSIRPGADQVGQEVELQRVIPVVEEGIRKFRKLFVSVDAIKCNVAREALKAGDHIINDVSGLGAEPRLADLCSEADAAYVLMHTKGNPKTMQKNPQYDDVVQEIRNFFIERLKQLKQAGVRNVILDPGIGFGKTKEHNLRIIQQLEKFTTLNQPILVGASRKTVISEVLDGRSVDGRLAGTIALHYHSLLNGGEHYSCT